MKREFIVAIEYVEQRNGGYYITGSRVSLDSVVYSYLRGESVEGIAESFPALGIEQVFGALAFYTANLELIDTYLATSREEYKQLQIEWRKSHPALYAKLLEARNHTPASGS